MGRAYIRDSRAYIPIMNDLDNCAYQARPRFSSRARTPLARFQNTLGTLPEHEMKALAETDALIEGNKTLAAEIKAVSAGGMSL